MGNCISVTVTTASLWIASFVHITPLSRECRFFLLGTPDQQLKSLREGALLFILLSKKTGGASFAGRWQLWGILATPTETSDANTGLA